MMIINNILKLSIYIFHSLKHCLKKLFCCLLITVQYFVAVPLKPNVFEYTLKTLQKSTEYSVYVMASTVKGGKNSSLIFFKTNGNGK